MDRVKRSVSTALVIAALYTVLLVALNQSNPTLLVSKGVTLPSVLAIYWGGALLAGILVGLLWRVAKTTPGAIVIGFLVALPVMFGFALLRSTPYGVNTEDLALSIVLPAVFVGGLGGPALAWVLNDERES